MTKTNRKYLPTFSELLDRLSITQLKEVLIPEHREEYSQEIQDILHDLDAILVEEKPVLDANMLRALIVLSQMNLHIWHNESNFRKGIKDGNNLELTHGLNGVRNTAKNKIQEAVGGRKDYKVDNVEAFSSWVPSWKESEDKVFIMPGISVSKTKMVELKNGLEKHPHFALPQKVGMIVEPEDIQKAQEINEAKKKLLEKLDEVEESFNDIKNLSFNSVPFSSSPKELNKVDVFDSKVDFVSEMEDNPKIKTEKKEKKNE